MSLLYTNTRDQAILAFTIKEAADVAKKSGSYVGRTAVQKTMYFLGVRGVETNYKFDIHHYGPFCEQILWDIDLLLADGVIEEQSRNTGKFSNYSAGNSSEELISLHHGKINQIRDIVRSVVEVLIPLKPIALELMATLDYVYRQERAKGSNDGIKEKVLQRFAEIKKDKFPLDLVSKTYDSMVSAMLLS